MIRIRKEREDESKENRRRMFVDRVEMSRKKPRCWRDTEAEEEDPGSHVAGSAARVAADEEQSPPLQRKQCSLCSLEKEATSFSKPHYDHPNGYCSPCADDNPEHASNISRNVPSPACTDAPVGTVIAEFGPDWDMPEATRPPPPTGHPELDEALDALAQPATAAPPPATAAPPASAVQQATVSNQRVAESAARAYEAIVNFRETKIHGLMKSCIIWLEEHMANFKTVRISVFGSVRYNLELCSSDVDIVVILGPGQNSSKWLAQLAEHAESSTCFDYKRRFQLPDCLQTKFQGMSVDIKPIHNDRKNDFAIRTTDCLAAMLKKRSKSEPDFYKKHNAILIFKLLCHYLRIVQHH